MSADAEDSANSREVATNSSSVESEFQKDSGFNPVAFIHDYINAIKASLTDYISINDAVKTRETIIANPKVRNVNDGTLDEIANQFDNDGKKLPTATYGFHNPDRAKDEMDRYTNSALSDWEKIIVVAAFFKASVEAKKNHDDTISKSDPKIAQVQSLTLDAIQVIVANELGATKVIKQLPGFNVSEAYLDKLNEIQARAPQIAAAAEMSVNLVAELRAQMIDLSKRKSEILARVPNRNEKKLNAADQQKYAILVKAIAVINKFNLHHDLQRLSTEVDEVKNLDSQRSKGGATVHKTSALIDKLSQRIAKEVVARHHVSPTTPTVVSPEISTTDPSHTRDNSLSTNIPRRFR